jgi:hypothetical protein
MSAINPASFASPSLGLQAPSGIGPGAVGVTRAAAQVDRRPLQQEQNPYNGLNQNVRGYQGPAATSTFSNATERSQVQPTAFQQQNFAWGYSPFHAAPRSTGVSGGGYTPNLLHQNESFAAFAPQTDFQHIAPRFPSPHGDGNPQDDGDYSRRGDGHPTGNDAWMNSFQGLSLNTR